MKNTILPIIAGLLLFAVGCTKDMTADIQDNPSSDGSIVISFGSNHFDFVEVTRMAMADIIERRITNIYVMIFEDAADDKGTAFGNRVYGRYFDYTNRVDNISDYVKDENGNSLDTDRWVVYNQTQSDIDGKNENPSHGQIRMKAPSVKKGRIYLIANINPAVFDLSPESLNTVDTEEKLLDLTYRMSHSTPFRTGSSMMISKGEIKIDPSNAAGAATLTDNLYDVETQKDGPTLMFRRTDARISVKVKIDPFFVTKNTDGVYQSVTSFTPTSWQVASMPLTAYVLEHTAGGNKVSSDAGFFDSDVYPFEANREETLSGTYTYTYTETLDDGTTVEKTFGSVENPRITENSFEFYMLANHQSYNKHLSVGNDYHLRDRQNKDDEGRYAQKEGQRWEYAPENGTYIILKGEIQLKPQGEQTDGLANKTLNANVVYYIHLGDFGSEAGDFDNYDIDPNTHYTYTVRIKSVNKIELEVHRDTVEGWDKGNEENSGAMGEVYRTQEGLFVCDSHFEQQVFRFSLEAMQRKDLTWYVSTPFGRKGSPDIIGADRVEVPTGLDYKWVSFHINSKFDQYWDKNNALSQYSGTDITNGLNRNRIYFPYNAVYETTGEVKAAKSPGWAGFNTAGTRGTKPKYPYTMDVVEFCKALRDERALALSDDPEMREQSIFCDPDYVVESEDGKLHSVYVTIFVDEFFYDEDPITGLQSPTLWHRFVGSVDNRMMHILCDAHTSADGDSAMANSVVSIIQRPIQTIYEPDVATEGWGVETVDETQGISYFWHTGEARGGIGTIPDPPTHNWSSIRNGRYNTAALWNLLENNRFKTGSNRQQWNKYVDHTRANWDEYKSEVFRQSNGKYDPENQKIYHLADESDKISFRYACLARNRDENGNGYIDAAEIKWYLACQNQLNMLYIGDQGLTAAGQLYTADRNANTKIKVAGADVYAWRSHIICSTKASGSVEPLIIWAEEGVSTSPYSNEYEKYSRYSIRCIRNLGIDPQFSLGGSSDMTQEEIEQKTEEIAQADIYDEKSFPRSAVTVRKDPQSGRYAIDLSLLNNVSSRLMSHSELVPSHETKFPARPYLAFIVSDNSFKAESTDFVSTVKTPLEQGRQLCKEKGYHIANIREATLLRIYADKIMGYSSYPYGCCSIYSFSPLPYGNNFDTASGTLPTWIFNINETNPISVAGANPTIYRCVKDVDPSDIASWDIVTAN